MNVICDIFQDLGQYSRRRIALKIEEMSAIPFTSSSLIALVLILSCLGAFLGFRRWINSVTSREVKGLMRGDVWKGECRYSVICGAILEE